MRHDDLQPVLARLLDLLGQPLPVADEALLVEVEQHVRRAGRSIISGGDRETGNGGGDLGGQLQSARVGRRGPERARFGKGERLALELARHAEREGGLVQKVGRTEEHRLWFQWGRSGDGEDYVAAGCGRRRLGDDLEGDELKLLDAIPDRERPVLVKDGRLQVLGALVAQRLQRPAALCRVRFLDEDERLVLLERRANLSKAVLWRGRGGRYGQRAVEAGWEGEARLGAEVALREEEEDDLRALDVLLKRPDILQIIYL